MSNRLRALIVEDSEEDAYLLVWELQRSGYDVESERVESRVDMKRMLLIKEWDVILCDYSLPKFSAMDALATLQESGVDIPFLVISGTIDEEAAVTILKAGADDFIVKGRFARLVPAIERERRDAQMRQSYWEGKTRQEDLTASLESVSAELERFLYTAFHELRSPLVTIKGFIGRLIDDLSANSSFQVSKDIERISGATEKMNVLLSDLLKLSRIGRVIHQPQEVGLLQLTRETVARLDARIQAANAIVTISTDLPIVYGDPVRLQEVLENLIENAIKFSVGIQNPRIEIGAEKQEGQQVIFVRDNGCGIEPRYHNRIFNLFEKLDLTTEGSGIGLAIVKRIIEFHGGSIWVKSEGEDKGSTFYFKLPDSKK